MPDWSYHTVLKPALFALPRSAGRRFVTGFLGLMTKLPFGAKVVDWLGHMHPPEILRKTVGGVELTSPVGLAAVVDPGLTAAKAFERFGFGLLCAGPVSVRGETKGPGPRRLKGTVGLMEAGFRKISLGDLLARLKKRAPKIPLAVKMAWEDGADAAACLKEVDVLLGAFSPYAAFLLLDARLFPVYENWSDADRKSLLQRLAASKRLALIEIPFNRISKNLRLAQEALAAGVKGFVVGPQLAPEGLIDRPSDLEAVLQQVRALRQQVGDAIVFTSAAVASPRDFLQVKEAGADGAFLGSGFVHSGPGLPKRINEALETVLLEESSAVPVQQNKEPWKTSWFWGAIMGGSMLLGSAMALVFALTRVILPYDESMTGITRPMLEAFNPKIIRFMIHDRATLAGTMTSVGALYVALSVYGIRRGQAWAQHIVVASAMVGFLSFLSFLGSGYFDPFHGFVTAVLFQFLLLVIVLDMPEANRPEPLQLDNDRVWKMGLWGQTAFVVQGFALILAGVTIGVVGMTTTLVAEDVEYLGITADAIRKFHPSLLALIAHDRETFGNMLVCSGIVVLFSALWGFRYGRKWLWWIWLVAGYPPYLQTLWIHVTIGYENLFHLLPVFLGLALQTFGLIFCYPFLMGRVQAPGFRQCRFSTIH